MNRNALALAVTVVMGALAQRASARDPGPVDVRGRDAAVSRGRPAPARPPAGGLGYDPASLTFDDIHGSKLPKPPAQPRRRLYEEVEDAVDRGTGRIEDEQTYQLRRLRDDRDERLGRIAPRREAERFEEEYDRRRRIDQRRERQRQVERERAADAMTPAPQRPATAVERTPTPGGSTLARFVAEQEALLSAARERYQRDLGAAEAERDAAIDAADTREGRARARMRFEERRSELTREYQQYRRKVLGAE